jgi:hypothetical protein
MSNLSRLVRRTFFLLSGFLFLSLTCVSCIYGLIKFARSEEPKNPVAVSIGDYTQTISSPTAIATVTVPSKYIEGIAKNQLRGSINVPVLASYVTPSSSSTSLFEYNSVSAERTRKTEDWHISASSAEAFKQDILGKGASPKQSSQISFILTAVFLMLSILSFRRFGKR